MYTKSMIRQDMKARAKNALAGNWFVACMILLVQALLSFGFTALESAFVNTLDMGTVEIGSETFFRSALVVAPVVMLLSMFLLIPLSFGIVSWYMSLAMGKNEGIGHIFTWFESGKNYGRALGVSLTLTVRTLLYTIPLYIVVAGGTVLFLIAGSALGVSADFVVSDPILSGVQVMLFVGLIVLTVVLMLVSMILYMIFIMRYAMVDYLVIKNRGMKIREAFKLSIAMMKGHKREMFVFGLSFFGWFLLVPLTCGLITFFLVPYMQTSMTMFAFHVIDSYQKQHGLPSMFEEQLREEFVPASFASKEAPEAPEAPEAATPGEAPQPPQDSDTSI